MPAEIAQPFAVVTHLGAFAVQDLVDLLEIRVCIGAHLLPRERRTRLGLPRGIADHGREIAHQKNRRVPFVLKMLQLPQNYGVAQMQVRCRGVDAQFHAQRLAGRSRALQLCAQLFFANNFGGAFTQRGELFVYGAKCLRRGHEMMVMKWDLAMESSRKVKPL